MKKLNMHFLQPKYRADIDGLRAIAILSVVTFHAFPTWMRGGFIGVDIFFVISGFLISTIIFDNLDSKKFSFIDFYSRRVKRIFPALVLVLFSCLIFGWLLLVPDELNQLGKHIAASASFVSNLILWSEAGYFDNSAETKPLLHLWSLGIEEQFYLLWPFVLWLGWRLRINLLVLTILVTVISFYINIEGIKKDPIATFYSPQTRFWELSCGGVLAWFLHYKNNNINEFKSRVDAWLAKITYRKTTEAGGIKSFDIISFFGFLLLVYSFWRINKDVEFPGKWAAIPVTATVLIILAGPKAWLNRTILSSNTLVFFGLISYPLYLWHWPIISFSIIIENGMPSIKVRAIALLLSILLAWLTVRFLETPLRFSDYRLKFRLLVLCGTMFLLGIIGVFISKGNLIQTYRYENLIVSREGFEHAFGHSLSWYEGKNNWLFLGNAYENTVAKLKLSIVPSDIEIRSVTDIFSKISNIASINGIKTVLIVGPNKSSIYPEFLPEKLVPSPTKYSSLFLSKLKEIPGLIVYDPTHDLLVAKKEGVLYWKTDTHWNNKGAFVAYSGFSRLLNLPTPSIKFIQGQPYSGDLIGISNLKNFPIDSEDSWDIIWKEKPSWNEEFILNEKKTAFGNSSVVNNSNALSEKYVWIVGDSFALTLKQYFNATFKQVRYIGHWSQKLNTLPDEIKEAREKPDLIIVVRVERSF